MTIISMSCALRSGEDEKPTPASLGMCARLYKHHDLSARLKDDNLPLSKPCLPPTPPAAFPIA